jgi:hypothetical protein
MSEMSPNDPEPTFEVLQLVSEASDPFLKFTRSKI